MRRRNRGISYGFDQTDGHFAWKRPHMLQQPRQQGVSQADQGTRGPLQDGSPQKVGHGLRDARISVTRNAGNNNVLQKNSSPTSVKQKDEEKVAPAFVGEPQTLEEKERSEADTTEVITTDVGLKCDASQTLLPICLKNVVTSSSLLGLDSELQEYSAIEDEWEDGVFSFDVRKVEESIDNGESGSDDNRDTELGPYACSFSADAEADQLLKRWGRSWDDVTNAITLSDVSPITGTTQNAYDLDAVSMALKMYSSVYGQSLDNRFDDDPCLPLGCAVEDAHSLCHWFRNIT
ncbi:hypothetical protein MHU86_2364 [Fragilaria crotonensis]|nr:hypothetical protein MHU86_2364 [Fragilaria crotonensis]